MDQSFEEDVRNVICGLGQGHGMFSAPDLALRMNVTPREVAPLLLSLAHDPSVAVSRVGSAGFVAEEPFFSQQILARRKALILKTLNELLTDEGGCRGLEDVAQKLAEELP